MYLGYLQEVETVAPMQDVGEVGRKTSRIAGWSAFIARKYRCTEVQYDSRLIRLNKGKELKELK